MENKDKEKQQEPQQENTDTKEGVKAPGIFPKVAFVVSKVVEVIDSIGKNVVEYKKAESKVNITIDDKIETELAEIKELLKKAQKRADVLWVYSIGFAGVVASLALVAIKASTWEIIVVFLGGLAIMLLAPYFVRK